MSFEEFHASLQSGRPPEGPALVKALWYDKQGQWDRAHDLAQNVNTPDGAWVHAYLHRKEGDLWNADYWYRRANRHRPDLSLDQEWEQLTRYLTE